MCMFTVYPICKNIYLSFCKSGFRYKVPAWVGLENFKDLFADPVFWKVLVNTIVFLVITVIPSMVIGFILAIVLNSKFKGLRFLRSAFFYPVVMPMIAVACIWRYLYMPENGMFATLIEALFHIKIGDVLSQPQTVLPCLAIMYVWKESGYLMIFFLSGLQNMSEDYFEAAKIDGGNFWTILTRITVPLMAPTTLFVTMIELTNAIKLVDHIVILTQGKPNNGSNLLMHYIYQLGYQFFDQGKASAVTTILLILLMVISLPRFFNSDKKVHYN
ncbi:MAG: sugar ABC transporter permease [Eubacteriales bacterium]|nr:sugar ABC transporter permease [Eubacteriales bacterium]